ncbi:MAG: hypothetical protein J5I28_10420, partial [Acidimicrobiales bacterium]|nr:hypothetical protein [Acidimicrobiales bacterium]
MSSRTNRRIFVVAAVLAILAVGGGAPASAQTIDEPATPVVEGPVTVPTVPDVPTVQIDLDD